MKESHPPGEESQESHPPGQNQASYCALIDLIIRVAEGRELRVAEGRELRDGKELGYWMTFKLSAAGKNTFE